MKLMDMDRRIIGFLQSRPTARVQEISDTLSFRKGYVTNALKRLGRKGIVKSGRLVSDPEEKWTFLVTLVPQGRGPMDLSFFRELRSDSARVVEAWFNYGGSLTQDWNLADGFTLLVRATDGEAAAAFRDRVTDVGIHAGYHWSKVHCIPLLQIQK